MNKLFVKKIGSNWWVSIDEDFDSYAIIKAYIENEEKAVKCANRYGKKYYQSYEVEIL